MILVMNSTKRNHQSSVPILLVILILTSIGVISTNAKCVDQCVCIKDDAVEAVLCYNAKLKQLPSPESQYKILSIKDNHFNSSIIRKSNMTGLSHLTSLKIIYSNLEKIEVGAFDGMKQLTVLDLSFNHFKTIMPHTFMGLNLKELHLMHNDGLKLVDTSFKGLKVKELNIRSCQINRINSKQFRNIGLHKLFLFNNNIETADQGFVSILTDPKAFIDLSANPINCDCRLRWLLAHLQTRLYTEMKHINVTCKKPSQLVGQSLVTNMSFEQRRNLEEKMVCKEPKVTGLSIEFGDMGKSAVLKCSSDIDGKEVDKDSQMLWYFEENGRFVKIPEKPMLSDDNKSLESLNEFTTKAPQLHTKTVAVNVTFPANKFQHIFKCRTYNPNNNFYSSSLYVNTNDNSKNPQQELLLQIRTPERLKPSQKSIETKVPTKTDSNKNLVINQSQSYVHKKQFTILEMIGVVIGTFVITIFLLLIIGHCIKNYSGCFWRCQKSTTPIKPFTTTTPNLNTTFPISSTIIPGLDYRKPSQQTQYQYNNSTTPNTIHKNISNSYQSQETPKVFNYSSYQHHKLLDNNHTHYSQTADSQNPTNINSDTISNEYDIPRVCETTHNFAPPLPIFDHIEYLDFKNPSSKLFTSQ